MSLVTVFAAGSTAESCKDKGYYVELANGNIQCSGFADTDIGKIADGTVGKFVVTKDGLSLARSIEITKDVIFDLGGHTYTIEANGVYTIKGANVTVKNGTLVVTGNAFKINSADEASTLTFDKTVTVKSTNTGSPVVQVDNAKYATTVDVKGNWTVGAEIVDCAAGEDEKLTINLDATVKSTTLSEKNSLLTLDAGTTVVNVNGGAYTSNKRVFTLVKGTLNVNKGAVLTAKGDSAIVVSKPNDAEYTQVLKIEGPEVTSESGYAVWFNDEEGKYSIIDGTFTSSKDKDGKQYLALYINSVSFLEKHKGMISKGKFTGSVVGDVAVGTDEYRPAEKAIADLVGNATINIKKTDQI